jgi:glutaredoxin
MISRAFLALLLAAPALALAQQYRWIDESGRVQYGDAPPPGAKNVQKKDLRGAAGGAPAPYALERAMKNAPVTLYSHPDCKSPCQLARDVLNKRGVPFKETVVMDEKLLAELKSVSGGEQVPVLVVGRVVETTISAEAYNGALDTAGYPAAGVLPTRSQAAPEPPQATPEPPKAAPEPAAEKKAPEDEAPRATGPYAPGAPPQKPLKK